jgi:hypothetical protein
MRWSRLGTLHNNDEEILAVSERLQIKSSIPASIEFLNSSRDGKMRGLCRNMTLP